MSIIKIKRSLLTISPATLEEGELAYSFLGSSKTLFIGDGTNVIAIGGQADHDKLASIEAGAQVNTVDSVAGKTGVVTLVKDDITNFTESDYVHTTGTETIGGNKTFSNNVIITGDLTVNGTVTQVNTTEVNIGDNILVLNSDETGTPSQNAGIEVERGTSDNAFLLWDESVDKWGVKIGANPFEAFSIEGHTHVAADITDFTTEVELLIQNYINNTITLNDLSGVVITTPQAGNALVYNGTNWINQANSFLNLTDTPNSYVGSDGYFVQVNSGDGLLEFTNIVDGGSF